MCFVCVSNRSLDLDNEHDLVSLAHEVAWRHERAEPRADRPSVMPTIELHERHRLMTVIERLVTNAQWNGDKQRYVAASSKSLNAKNTVVNSSLALKLRHTIKASPARIEFAALTLLEWFGRSDAPFAHKYVAFMVMDDFVHRSKTFRRVVSKNIAQVVHLLLDLCPATSRSAVKWDAKAVPASSLRSSKSHASITTHARDSRKLRKLCLRCLQDWKKSFGDQFQPLAGAVDTLLSHGIRFPRARDSSAARSEQAEQRHRRERALDYEQLSMQYDAGRDSVALLLRNAGSSVSDIERDLLRMAPMVAALSGASAPAVATARGTAGSHALTVLPSSSDEEDSDFSDCDSDEDDAAVAANDVKSSVVWESGGTTEDASPGSSGATAASAQLSKLTDDEFAQMIGLAGGPGATLEIKLSKQRAPVAAGTAAVAPASQHSSSSSSSSSSSPSSSKTLATDLKSANVTAVGNMIASWDQEFGKHCRQWVQHMEAMTSFEQSQRETSASAAESSSVVEDVKTDDKRKQQLVQLKSLLDRVERARTRLNSFAPQHSSDNKQQQQQQQQQQQHASTAPALQARRRAGKTPAPVAMLLNKRARGRR